jgi:predicted DNA-binding protein (UPF0278 family)
MSRIDYDIGTFLLEWTPAKKQVQFTAAVKELVEKVQDHGFNLGVKAAQDEVRDALDRTGQL